MKSGLAVGTLLLAATLTQPAASQQNSRAAPPVAKKKPHARPAPVPTRQPVFRGWRPADPSFDQQGRRYQPPPGLACSIDLGYGRWASCDWDH